jgi:hypothetical protein
MTAFAVALQNAAPLLPYFIQFDRRGWVLMLARMLLYVISAGKNLIHHSPYKPLEDL